MKRSIAVLIRAVLVLVVVGLIGLGGARLIQNKKHELSAAPKYGVRPTPVHVVKAELGTLTQDRTYLGVCEPVRQADVSARITATIDEVACDEGSTVTAGQVLIRLDDREIRQNIAEAESEIERARSDLTGNEAVVESLKQSVAYWNREAERDRSLADRGDIPGSQAEGTQEKANEFTGRLLAAQQQTRSLRHRIESLQRRKGQLEIQLSYCLVESPYDGLVVRRLVDPGDLASVGKTLLRVEDRSSLKLSFDIPQQDMEEVHEGLGLRFKADGRERRGALTHLYPSLSADRTIRAESVLGPEAAAGLTCGSYVPVSVEVGRIENAVLVPSTSLIEGPDGTTYVFVVRDGKLEHPMVTVLGRSKDRAAITGIEPGEQVVVSTYLGWANLSGGMAVEPVQ